MGKTPPTQKVPKKALKFSADLGLSEGAEGVTPVTITARTKEPVDHPWWGRFVHDMAGFRPSKPTLPIDYCHNDSEVLGFLDKFDIATGDLVVSGALTPFTADDRASEIIHKQSKKVPYEASVYFDSTAMVLESVPEGMAVQVNGYQFDGPGIVARQWMLRGVAICPYGQDANTSVAFSDREGDEVTVTFTEGNNVPPEPTEKPEEKKPDEPKTPAAEVKDPPAIPPTDPPANPPTELSAGKKFLNAFGAKGGVWFAEGKTFEEAQTQFTAELKADNERLTSENAELKTKLAASRGERTPVSFQQDGDAASSKSPALGKLTAFANSIKLAN